MKPDTQEAMKVKSEDILKPGAVLEVKKIDFTDPRVIEIVKAAKEGYEELKKLTEWTQEKQDNLRRVITI